MKKHPNCQFESSRNKKIRENPTFSLQHYKSSKCCLEICLNLFKVVEIACAKINLQLESYYSQSCEGDVAFIAYYKRRYTEC